MSTEPFTLTEADKKLAIGEACMGPGACGAGLVECEAQTHANALADDGFAVLEPRVVAPAADGAQRGALEAPIRRGEHPRRHDFARLADAEFELDPALHASGGLGLD